MPTPILADHHFLSAVRCMMDASVKLQILPLQGTAATALAGIYGALTVQGKPLHTITQQQIVVIGAGSAGMGVTYMIAQAMVKHVSFGSDIPCNGSLGCCKVLLSPATSVLWATSPLPQQTSDATANLIYLLLLYTAQRWTCCQGLWDSAANQKAQPCNAAIEGGHSTRQPLHIGSPP